MKQLLLLFFTLHLVNAQNKTIYIYNEFNAPINNYLFNYNLDTIKTNENGRFTFTCKEKFEISDDFYFTESYNCKNIKDLDTIIAYSMYNSLTPINVISKPANKTLIYKFKNKNRKIIHFSTKFGIFTHGLAAFYPFGEKYKNYNIKEITFYFNRSIKNKCISDLIIQPVIYEYTEEKELNEVHFPIYYKIDKKYSNVTMDISSFNYKISNPNILIGFKVFSLGKQKNKCDNLNMFEQSNFSVRASEAQGKKILFINNEGGTHPYRYQAKPDIKIKFSK